MAVYDDEKTKTDDLHKITGISPSEARDMEARAVAGADQDKAAANEKSALGSKENNNEESAQSDKVGKGFTGNKKKQNLLGKPLRLSRKKTSVLIISLVGAGGAGIMGLFGFMNVFKLDHFISNIEIKSHMRYQIDFDGRSSKFRNAYIKMRLTEVEGPNIEPGSQNRIFRADRVDNNKPLTDWYRTLRTNKFEEKVFNKEGIKFTSIEYIRPDGSRTIRPAKIELNDKIFELNLTDNEMRVLRSGDIAAIDRLGLGSKLDEFITRFDNDQEARRHMKEVIDRNLRPWQVMKRRHVRKDIQNKTGVRDWRFFEKTRHNVSENIKMTRNKIIQKSLPADTRTGKVVQCMFGVVTDCKSSKDAGSPANRADQSVSPTIGISEMGEGDGENKSMRKAFVAKIAGKLIPIYNIAEMVDMFGHIDKMMKNGGLSKMVIAARTAQAIGLYTTYSIARDQIKTGELTNEEMDVFMDYANDLGNNEGWDSAVMKTSFTDGDSVYAAALEKDATSKKEYCSEEYQKKIEEGKVDKNQSAFACSDKIIGGGSNGEKIEEFYTNSTALSTVGSIAGGVSSSPAGWVVGAISDVIGFIADPIIKGTLKVLGLDDDLEKLGVWLTDTLTEELGAGPMTDTDTPAGVEGNIVIQGAAATAEASARQNGAAATTRTSRIDAEKRIAAYQNELEASQSFAQKYLAISNPESVAASQLYAVSTSDKSISPLRSISSIFSGIASITQLLLTKSGSAQSTNPGYDLAEFAAIQTYDYPKKCIDMDPMDMTPQNSTNADDLGLIPAEELTWDLVRKKEAFYDRLYQDEPDDDTAMKVYNCALLDNAVMGSMGAMYGYTDDNAITSMASSSSGESSSSGSETAGAEIVGDPFKTSVDVACADGTKDIGIHDAYNDGEKIKMRMCAVQNFPCDNQECMQIGGGKVIVNSRVSGAIHAMVEAAKSDGVTLSASSSFRTMAHQQSLCPCDTVTIAKPGYSNHQSGTAIDFKNAGGQKIIGATCSNRARGTGQSAYDWLLRNAHKFGYKQYAVESWHWDPMDAASRCGPD